MSRLARVRCLMTLLEQSFYTHRCWCLCMIVVLLSLLSSYSMIVCACVPALFGRVRFGGTALAARQLERLVCVVAMLRVSSVLTRSLLRKVCDF